MPRVRFTPGCGSRTRGRPARLVRRGHTASGCIILISCLRNIYLISKEHGQRESRGDINVTSVASQYNEEAFGIKPCPFEHAGGLRNVFHSTYEELIRRFSGWRSAVCG